LFNYATDPDATNNLVNDPQYKVQYEALTKALEDWMVRTQDPMLDVFRNSQDAAIREAYMEKVMQAAADRAKPNRKKQTAKKTTAAVQRAKQDAVGKGAKQDETLSVAAPANVQPGTDLEVSIVYQLLAGKGSQLLNVTLKSASNERIERRVLKIAGSGQETMKFSVPTDLSTKHLTIAAFVGEDFNKSQQRYNSPPILLDLP
jgi:N-sulfoglucosamine sulfohydrolase